MTIFLVIIMLIMVPWMEHDVTPPLNAVIGASLLFVLVTVLATPACQSMTAAQQCKCSSVPPYKQHSIDSSYNIYTASFTVWSMRFELTTVTLKSQKSKAPVLCFLYCESKYQDSNVAESNSLPTVAPIRRKPSTDLCWASSPSACPPSYPSHSTGSLW